MIIEIFPAREGDALLIQLDNNINIVIDMGYATTYKQYIRDRFVDINNKGFSIDLMILTHMDEDHIGGAIEFFAENGNANRFQIVDVRQVLFNSYRHLQFDKEKIPEISEFERNMLQEIVLENRKKNLIDAEEDKSISAIQGSSFAGILFKNGYNLKRWNKSFDFKAVSVDNPYNLVLEHTKLTLLSPDNNKLRKLSKMWMSKLSEYDMSFNLSDEIVFDDAFEMYTKQYDGKRSSDEFKEISKNISSFESILCESVLEHENDKSISNGSSIAFVIESNKVKGLVLGDSHDDIIVENLRQYKKNGNTLKFDFIKVSHHGSLKNNFKWVDEVIAENYIFTTNGKKHNHPSLKLIAKIINSNKQKKKLIFNYPLKSLDEVLNKELMIEYNYDVIIGNGEQSLKLEVVKNVE